MLPEAQREYFTALWQEYEDGESADARFALLLDRTMPMLMNLHNEGQSWVENGISLEQVAAHCIDRRRTPRAMAPYGATPADAQRKGWLKWDRLPLLAAARSSSERLLAFQRLLIARHRSCRPGPFHADRCAGGGKAHRIG